jgi:hypothetical protein
VLKKNRPLLLILVCLVLGVLVFFDYRQRSEGDVVAPAQTQGPARASANEDASSELVEDSASGSSKFQLHNPLAAFDKATLKDWVERPLFAPSRQRPPAAAVAERPLTRKVAIKRPPPTYDLLGIVRDGDRAIALLRKKGEGTSFRVEVGDMIGGWRVARMEPASVVLEREDGTSQTVALSRE